MNKFIGILITIYVLSILAWSGMVRAQTVVLSQASFDNNNLMLLIEGRTNSACGVSVQAEVLKTPASPAKTQVNLQVVKNQNVDFCITLETQREFSKILDIRSLGLNGGSYEFTLSNPVASLSESFRFTANIPEGSHYPGCELLNVSGFLSRSDNGFWVLTTNHGQVMILKSRFDLTKYLGLHVSVEGFEILHRTGPSFEVSGHSPLRVSPTSEDPTMFLLSISAEML